MDNTYKAVQSIIAMNNRLMFTYNKNNSILTIGEFDMARGGYGNTIQLNMTVQESIDLIDSIINHVSLNATCNDGMIITIKGSMLFAGQYIFNIQTGSLLRIYISEIDKPTIIVGKVSDREDRHKESLFNDLIRDRDSIKLLL